MLEVSSEPPLTTVGVVAPPTVETKLREAQSAVETGLSIESVDNMTGGIPDSIDSVVVVAISVEDERTDGGAQTRPAELCDRARRVASELTTPPVVLLAPSDAPVTEALQAGVAEYLPPSVIEEAPATVLERSVDAAAEAGGSDYRAIYDNVSEPLTLHDPATGELVHANRRLCELLGYDRTELIQMQVGDYTADVKGYGQEAAMELITSATEEGIAGPFEWPLESDDGTKLWVEATLTPVEIAGQERILATATDVTDRVRREQEYEQIFDGVNDAITIHDPTTGDIVDVNSSYLDLTGYDWERIREQGIEGLSATEEGYTDERARELITTVADTGADKTVEWRIVTADSERRTIESSLTATEIDGQQRVLSISRDITEQRRRQREFEQIFNAVEDPITIHDPETAEHIRVNDGFCSLLGYSRDELTDMSIEDYSVAEAGCTVERAREFVRSVMEEEKPKEMEWAVETSSGEQRWLQVKGTTAEVGGRKRFVSIDRDITERKRREREYEQIFDGVNDVITIHDPETGEYRNVNETLCELTGYSRAEILEMGINGVSVTEEGYTAQRASEFIESVIETGESDTVEWKVETADGEHRWLEVNGSVATIGGEKQFISLDRDITELKRREHEYEQIFNSVTDIINVYDPETGALLDVNETMCELLGYDEEQILELGPEGVSASELGYDREVIEGVISEVAETGEPVRGIEWALRTASGDTVWLEVNATPAEINGRRCVLAIARDVTERRDREERVQVLNRVLRHNLRNDMDATKGYATAIEQAAESDSLRDHARRIGDTADKLLDLSAKARSAEAILRDDDSGHAAAARLLQRVVGEARDRFESADFVVSTSGASADLLVEADVFRLVMRELVENAVEHGAGPVEIHLHPTPRESGDSVTVSVSDTGPGIPDRVLTPLQTSGETQLKHNQGLGLWLINWGVRRLGGSLEFNCPDNGGTTAVFELPVVHR